MKVHARIPALIAAVAAALVACSESVAPLFPALTLRAETDPGSVQLGDSVIMRAIIENTTGDSVALSGIPGCGVPIRFEVREELGPARFYLGGAGLCILRPIRVVGPFETDTIVFTFPSEYLARGVWRLRVGFPNREERLVQASTPVRFVVR